MEAVKTNSTVYAPEVLECGIKEMHDRGKTYDNEFCQERSMRKTVKMFNALHNKDLTEEMGWQFMEILKMVRASQGEYKLDNYIDGAAYAALAAEAGAKERRE